MNKGRTTENYNNSIEAPTRGFNGAYGYSVTSAQIGHSRGILGHSRAKDIRVNASNISQVEKAGVTITISNSASLNKLFFYHMRTIIKTPFLLAKTPIGIFTAKCSSSICIQYTY